MMLLSPVEITPRLLAGVRVNGAFIAIDCAGASEGRTRYRYCIDLPDGTSCENDDLRSGVGGGGLQAGLESLLSFLSACGESVQVRDRAGSGENCDLFPPNVGEWAAQCSDALTTLQCELDEKKGLILE